MLIDIRGQVIDTTKIVSITEPKIHWSDLIGTFTNCVSFDVILYNTTVRIIEKDTDENRTTVKFVYNRLMNMWTQSESIVKLEP